jgi:TetR/AcrR family transcriptional regulator, transcriptional repressor for nem operon
MILAAADLFHARGVHATSPGDVIAASGTGKGQFYHYFGNKEGLVQAVLETYRAEIRDGTAQVNYEIASLADLERWFRDHLALQQAFAMRRGCPFGTIGNELGAGDEPVRRALAEVFGEVRSHLLAFFESQKRQGRLRRGVVPGELADFCLTSIQGGMLLGKVMRDAGPVEHAVRQSMARIRDCMQ